MVQLIGIPYDGNSSFLKGAALAPARIRLAGTDGSTNASAERIEEIRNGINYQDNGDLFIPDIRPEAVYSEIKGKIQERLADNSKIICLGGDHSVSLPVIEAYAERYEGLHVLHFDAHADLYDNFDHNPFSHASVFARVMEKGKIRSLTQVGIRTLNKHQSQQAKRFDVRVIEMNSLSASFIQILRPPLYISIDLDVLDPAFAPGVSHHEPGGLSTRELLQLIQSIPVDIAGADIVEYNPVRDIHGMTAMVAYKVFKELVAKMSE